MTSFILTVWGGCHCMKFLFNFLCSVAELLTLDILLAFNPWLCWQAFEAPVTTLKTKEWMPLIIYLGKWIRFCSHMITSKPLAQFSQAGSSDIVFLYYLFKQNNINLDFIKYIVVGVDGVSCAVTRIMIIMPLLWGCVGWKFC